MIFKTHDSWRIDYEDLSSKCSSMSHEVYVWDIGVDSLKYIESEYTTNLVTIVRKKFLNLFLIRSFIRIFAQNMSWSFWKKL